MLDPASVDLGELCHALDDHTPNTSWWIDPASGRIRPLSDSGPDTPAELTAAGWRRVRPTESAQGYRDMAEFVAAVHHRRAADLLDRAINGRGAFRRFKDTLVEFPELRDQWFRFRDARSRRRALRWLATEGLVGPREAELAAAGHPDPAGEDEDLPAAVAVDLAMLYGERLQQVLLAGSWADSGGEGESELQLLVVLAEPLSPWAELARMDELLWRHTERAGLAVTAIPVGAAQLAWPDRPLLARAAAQTVRVA